MAKDEEPDYGRIAYEAYREYVGGRSVNNQEIPEWTSQSDALREAWTDAANAVLDEYESVTKPTKAGKK